MLLSLPHRKLTRHAIVTLLIMGGAVKWQTCTSQPLNVKTRCEQQQLEVAEEWCRQGKLREAIAAYSNAIQLNNACLEGYIGRAKCEEKLWSESQSLSDLQKASAIDPKDYQIYWIRSNLAMHVNNYEVALTNINRAIYFAEHAAKPASIGARSELYSNRATIFESQGKHEQAMLDCNSAIRLDPIRPWFYQKRGDIASKLKQYDQAIRDYSFCIELKAKKTVPKGCISGPYVDRGKACLAAARYKLAVDDFGIAIAQTPYDYRIYMLRAQAYDRLKQPALAAADRKSAEGLENEFFDNALFSEKAERKSSTTKQN